MSLHYRLMLFILFVITQMQEYRVRIDQVEGVADDTLTQFLRDKSDAFVLVHHQINDNPHYHAYVRTKYTQGNFSNYLKKQFPVKGDLYSNKKCASDRRHEYLSYLFNTKRGNVARYVSSEGVSELEIVHAREQAKLIADEFKSKVDKGKKTKFDIAEIVASREWMNLEELYECVLSMLIMNRMCTSSFVVKDIMSTAIVLSENTCVERRYLKDEIKRSICENFRR